MAYHCPSCGKEIGFGESICPNCKADVTGVWEQAAAPKNTGPKIAPGMGGVDMNIGSPFPMPSSNIGSPFPPPQGVKSSSNIGSPFPPAQNKEKSPFPSGNLDVNPFKSPVNSVSPFPPASQESKPFPPKVEEISSSTSSANAYLEIPSIGGKLPIQEGELRIGRDEIQGIATISLPDLNAYKNVSRKRENSEHFIIRNNNGNITIEDRGSTNGTYLGTDKITGTGPHSLKDGDKFIIPIEENGRMVQLEIILHK